MITLKQHNIKPYTELCVTLSQHGKCAYIAATGTGKSYIAARYIEDYHEQDKCIVITPTTIIGDNWKKLLPDINTLTYHGSCVNEDIESILLDKSVIILDEFHHIGAEKWGKPFFDILDKFEGKIIGLSATPIRYLDNCRNMVDEFFDGVCVNGLSLPEAIDKAVLPSFQYITALYNLPDIINNSRSLIISEGLKDSTKTLFQQLDIMSSKYSFNNILMKYLSDEKYFKIIVFVDMIESLNDISELFNQLELNFNSYTINSTQKTCINQSMLTNFVNDEKSSFLFCVDMINEGLHIDAATGIIMFRRTQSPAVYLQQIGRALSSSEYIDKPIIFDFVANHSNLKTYKSVQNNTIHYINSEIKDPCKQIIVSDYAMEEEELLQKIKDIYNGIWSDEEIRILRDNYGKMSTKELQKLLPGRSKSAISARACVEGLSYIKVNRWSNEEIQILHDNYGNISIDELQKLLPGRSINGIRHRVISENLTIKKSDIKWSNEEIQILHDNYGKMSINELQKLLPGRSEAAIRSRCTVKGFTGLMDYWSDEETKILRDNYGKMSDDELQKILPGRSKSAIKAKRKKEGLLRRAHWSDEEIRILRDNYGKMSTKELQKLLPGRKINLIRDKACFEKITKKN